MKVILKEDIDRLGKSGDIVEVSDGYARNYLIPRNKAFEASKSSMAVYQEERKQKILRENKTRRTAEILAKELEKVSFTAVVPVGEDDRIFGSVTSQTIANLLQEKGFNVDRKKIILDEPIRALGIYQINVKLHPEIEAKVKVWVVKE